MKVKKLIKELKKYKKKGFGNYEVIHESNQGKEEKIKGTHEFEPTKEIVLW